MNSNNDILYSDLIKILGEDNVKKSEPMKNHTTFRIGGDADLFATPVNAEQIHDTVIYLKKAGVPYYVVGNGSNLLDRKSTRLNSSHPPESRMPSSA